MTKRFLLNKLEDSTGVGQVGHVADGVQFPNGKCVICWRAAGAAVVIYDNIRLLEKVHTADGKSQVVWIDSSEIY